MNTIRVEKMRQSAGQAAKLMKALSNENRLLILCHLLEGEKSVGTLQQLVGLKQSALSQQLAGLRRENLVKTRRESQTIYYSLAGENVERVLALLYELYCAQAGQDSDVICQREN